MTTNSIEANDLTAGSEDEMIQILETLLRQDKDVTARAVARSHSTIKHASSITRNSRRSSLLESYKVKQKDIRSYSEKIKKSAQNKISTALAEKDKKILELERQIKILTASHLAMIRAVGEIGGMQKWIQFYEQYKSVRNEIQKLGALPSSEIVNFRP